MVARSPSTLESPGDALASREDADREPVQVSADALRESTIPGLDEPTQAISEPPPLPRRASTHLKLISGGRDFDIATISEDSPSLESDSISSTSLSGALFAASVKPGARAFGSSLADEPVPPLPKLPRPPVHIRREESVIQEAAWERSRPWVRASSFAGNLTDASISVARQTARGISQAVSKFETLPRSHQIGWIAVPYLAALMLILILVFARSGEAPAAEQITVPPVAAAAPAAAPASEVAPPAVPKVAAVPEPLPPEPEAQPRPSASTEAAVLPVRAKLFMRPSAKYEQFTRLRAGTELTLYPDIKTRRGWVLARTNKGTIGYLRTKHLR